MHSYSAIESNWIAVPSFFYAKHTKDHFKEDSRRLSVRMGIQRFKTHSIQHKTSVALLSYVCFIYIACLTWKQWKQHKLVAIRRKKLKRMH